MSEPPPPGRPSGAAASSPPASGGQTWSLLLPVLTFVVGLVLGAVVLALAQADDPDPQQPLAQASPTGPAREATPGASPGGLRVTVPAPCVSALEKAQVAYEVLDEAVDAVGDFDARRLADIVDRAQAERAMTEELVEACEDAAGAELVAPIGSPVSSPSP